MANSVRGPVSSRLVCRTIIALWLCALPAWCLAMEVEVEGVPAQIVDRVRNSIDLGPKAEKIDRPDAERRLALGRQQLEKAMSSFGYYRARVRGQLVGQPSKWKAVYRVTPGKAMTYGAVTIEITGPAGSEPSLKRYLSTKPLAAGDRVDQGRYESVKEELLRRTQALGYLDAHLSVHRVEVNLDTYSADARLVVDSGPLFRFGKIRLIQHILDDRFLRGYVTIKYGDRYSDRRLLELQQDLKNSDYFDKVRVDPRLKEAGPDGYVPIDVHLTPGKPSHYQAGLGFGTDTGVRGSLSWEERRLNRHGHRLGSSLQLSQIGGSAGAHYTIPFGDPRNDQYQLFANYVRNNPDTSNSTVDAVGIRRSTALGDMRLTLSFAYHREDFTVAGQSGLTNLFIPAAELSQVKADNRLFTRNGFKWKFSLEGSAGLISDFAFIQPHVSGKLIHSFGDLRLILRGEAAATAAKLQDLPASLRFFAGGDQSVRGFGYETLGPLNAQGQVTGGRRLLVGSVEADYGITDKWRVAAFFDAGNAFDTFNEPLRKSVGIGIRRITPIGPIRIDLAHPLVGGTSSIRLHVTFGPDL